jgi:hypothetical protein
MENTSEKSLTQKKTRCKVRFPSEISTDYIYIDFDFFKVKEDKKNEVHGLYRDNYIIIIKEEGVNLNYGKSTNV